MKTLTIATGDSEKSRAFHAVLLGYAVANQFWSGGQTSGDTVRPALLVLALSEAEAGPFVANLRLGRKALLGDAHQYGRHDNRTALELLKSAGYAFTSQRHPEGVVVTAYLPELYRLDLGMVDPAGVRFCMAPPEAWCAEERARLDVRGALQHARKLGLAAKEARQASWWEGVEAMPWFEELTRLVPHAALFCAYLDRRTRAPLIPDLRFYLQVLAGALRDGLATLSTESGHYRRDETWGRHPMHGFRETGLDAVGFAPGIACKASHSEVEALLAAEVDRFYKVVR